MVVSFFHVSFPRSIGCFEPKFPEHFILHPALSQAGCSQAFGATVRRP